MASNSITEKIILDIVTTLKTVKSLKSVAREWPTMDELKRTPVTMLPRVAVVHDLPVPKKWMRSIGSNVITADSVLSVSLFVYLQSPSPSIDAVSLVDDIWAAIMKDIYRGQNANGTEVYPKTMGNFGAITACKIDVKVAFTHGNDSI